MTEKEALTIFLTIQKCRHQALHTNDCGNCEKCQYYHEQEQIDGAVDLAISALEKQEQDRWIPVTERPPEVGQSVMISVAGVYTAEGCLKEDGNWCQFRWSAEHDRAVVGAWKPLPEPYTEEES